MDDIYKLALETIEMGKQALIFTPSRASAEKTAEEISKLVAGHYPQFEEAVLKGASTPTKQCKRLAMSIRKGIAFHHAGLLQKQKDLIETEFRKGQIKIICSTPTLAAGLSLPAYRVIVKSLKRYTGRGMDWIPVLEYLQMAGRAGRPEYESVGEAIAIAKDETDKEDIFSTYIMGVPEEIYSKLAVEPVLRTYLLSLIASGIIKDDESMLDFFARTFWAHQFGDVQKLKDIMERMLSLLQQWGFVESAKDDFVSASDLGERKLKATALGRRVSELYLDPLTARHLLDCLERPQRHPYALLQMICHTLEMRPLLRVKSKEQDIIQEELMKKELLEDEPSIYDYEYDDFVNSIKTALFFESWIEEKDEEFLLQKYDIRPGEVRVKIETADWLIYASEEFCNLTNDRETGRELRKLRVRVKNGVKEELLPLLKLKGVGRVRARKLFSNGIKDLGDIKRMDISSLSRILGKNLAENVKVQVGQAQEKVKDGARIGQLSIKKF